MCEYHCNTGGGGLIVALYLSFLLVVTCQTCSHKKRQLWVSPPCMPSCSLHPRMLLQKYGPTHFF